MIKLALIVGIGGFFGSAGRYCIQVLFVRLLPGITTSGTFVANILGCFIIGILMGFSSKIEKEWWAFLASGFCGGFTTFSAFCLENNQYFINGNSLHAIIYIFLSIVVGLLATFLGLLLGKLFI